LVVVEPTPDPERAPQHEEYQDHNYGKPNATRAATA
jgi:hypothetical protein